MQLPLEKQRQAFDIAIKVALTAVVLFVVCAGFRVIWLKTSPGLDSAWVYAINRAGPDTFAFGRDIAFTWGPLGYVLFAEGFGNNLQHNSLATFLITLLFALPLMRRAWSAHAVVPVLTCAVAYLVCSSVGLLPEHPVAFVLALWSGLALQAGGGWQLLVVGVMAGLCLYTKMSLGIMANSFLGVISVVLALRDRKSWRFIGAAWLLNLACVAVLAAVFFTDTKTFFHWLWAAAQVVAGYEEGVSVRGQAVDLVRALSIMGIFGWVAWRLRGKQTFWFALASAFTLFSFYKHGFVRNDPPHVLSFVNGFILIGCAWLIVARKPRETHHCAALVVLTLIIGLGCDPTLANGWRDWSPRMRGTFGLNQMQVALHPRQAKRAFAPPIEENGLLMTLRLPDPWLDVIKAHGNRLTPLPYELNFCAANPVTCAPPPTLLMYSTLTAGLDRWNASLLSGAGVKPTLLLEYFAIDDHNMFFDGPAFWQEALARYELSRTGPRLLLLTPRAQPFDSQLDPIGSTDLEFGEWTDVPMSENMVYASVYFERSLAGKIAAFLYRMPAVSLEMQFEDGVVLSHRLIRRVAQAGVLANHMPRDLNETAGLFAGKPVASVRCVRIVTGGNKGALFDKTCSIQWLESSVRLTTQPSEAAASDGRQAMQ